MLPKCRAGAFNGLRGQMVEDFPRPAAAASRVRRYITMTLDTHEFIGRFFIHLLTKGFRHIRQSGLFADAAKAAGIATARKLLGMPAPVARPPPPTMTAGSPLHGNDSSHMRRSCTAGRCFIRQA
jgi:hypothetical protein